MMCLLGYDVLIRPFIIHMLRLPVLKRFFSLDLHYRQIRKAGIASPNIEFNPTVAKLYEIAFLLEPPHDPHTRQSYVSSNGALCAYSGLKTGREPQNSRIVKDSITEKSVNWSKTNIPIDESSYDMIESIAVDYINHHQRCIVVDGYAGWDMNNRVKVRTYCTRTYHALFMRNMLIRPTDKELAEDFSKGVDINIFNAGEMMCSSNIPGLKSSTVTTLNLSQQKMIILGTQFAGEMKKSVFKILHYVYPRRGILTLHSAANLNKDNTSTIMCGLSATGKTALGLRSDERKLIGDDQICWGDDGLFNIEGGVYAKIINLDRKVEPEIFDAIKFGSIVQNASFYPNTRTLNFNDVSITPNARTSFPLEFLKNAKIPAVGPHPKNIIFLTCDTKGVLPPVAKLTQEQAAYQFLSGYTAKVGGADLSAKSPESTFSACFGEIFLPLHPTTYAKMFYEKVKKHDVNVWLVNTGWTYGRYGVGRRIKFEDSVKIVEAINDGSLAKAPTYRFKHFGFDVPTAVPGINPALFYPDKNWHSRVEYEEALTGLVVEFIENFDKKYKGKMQGFSKEIEGAAPVIEIL